MQQVGDADAEPAAFLGHQGEGGRVALPRRGGDMAGGGRHVAGEGGEAGRRIGGDGAARLVAQGGARGERLPAAVRTAGADGTVLDDRHMADMAGEAAAAAHQTSVADDAAADPVLMVT